MSRNTEGGCLEGAAAGWEPESFKGGLFHLVIGEKSVFLLFFSVFLFCYSGPKGEPIFMISQCLLLYSESLLMKEQILGE